jgi:hypothetical protein
MNPDTTGNEPILTLAAIVTIVVLIRFGVAVSNTLRRRDDLSTVQASDFLYNALQALREAPALVHERGRWFAGLRRAWAIALNTLREAVRRRMMWIVPIWFVVTLAAAWFLRPLDEEQDRYGLLMKLFLYGQLAAVAGATALTAVADLGNERRRRTLLTLLSKPVTRLELVIGKIGGQSLIAAVLLTATVTLTGLYFIWVDYRIRSDAGRRYQEARVRHEQDPLQKAPEPALRGLAEDGVLTVREVREPAGLRITALDKDGLSWMRSGSGQRAAAVFPPIKGSPTDPPMVEAHFRGIPIPHFFLRDRPDRLKAGRFPVDLTFTAIIGPVGDPRRTVSVPFPLQLNEELREQFTPILEADQRLRAGAAQVMVDLRSGAELSINAMFPLPISMMGGFTDDEGRRVEGTRIEVNVMCNFVGFYLAILPDSIRISGVSPETEGSAGGTAMPLGPAELRGSQLRKRQSILGVDDRQNPETADFRLPPDPRFPLLFPPDKAIWRFAGIRPEDLEEGRPAELRIKGVVDVNDQVFRETLVRLDFAFDDGAVAWSTDLAMEENRPLIVRLPALLLTGRPFNVTMTCRSSSHSIALDYGSARLSVSRVPFAWALARSGAILWMQATVPAALAVFASTFLSWPVGLLLTGFALLVGVVKPLLLPLGVGHELWRALYIMEPQTVETVLLTALKWFVWLQGRLIAALAFVAPDLRQFGGFEAVARGAAVPVSEVLGNLKWAAFYVLPLLLGAYWVMRFKEAGE